MRWMICEDNGDGGIITSHFGTAAEAANCIAPMSWEARRPDFRERVLGWLASARPGDVLKFPQGIVVRTIKHATEIDYEETD